MKDRKLSYPLSIAISEIESDVVIYVGGLNHDFDMESKDREDTVVQYWYSGTKGGTALAEVLFGDVNPSGKLAATFPKALADTPAEVFGEFPGGDTVHYNEGIFVGYRYYDTYNVEPEFCFGHGLSYTDFAYSALEVQENTKNDDAVMTASCKITNIGDVKGAEVVQLYISDVEASVPRPKKELKGFEKVMLEPGESKTVVFELKERDFSFYSVEEDGWKLENGTFEVMIGSSSGDIRLTQQVEIGK